MSTKIFNEETVKRMKQEEKNKIREEIISLEDNIPIRDNPLDVMTYITLDMLLDIITKISDSSNKIDRSNNYIFSDEFDKNLERFNRIYNGLKNVSEETLDFCAQTSSLINEKESEQSYDFYKVFVEPISTAVDLLEVRRDGKLAPIHNKIFDSVVMNKEKIESMRVIEELSRRYPFSYFSIYHYTTLKMLLTTSKEKCEGELGVEKYSFYKGIIDEFDLTLHKINTLIAYKGKDKRLAVPLRISFIDCYDPDSVVWFIHTKNELEKFIKDNQDKLNGSVLDINEFNNICKSMKQICRSFMSIKFGEFYIIKLEKFPELQSTTGFFTREFQEIVKDFDLDLTLSMGAARGVSIQNYKFYINQKGEK